MHYLKLRRYRYMYYENRVIGLLKGKTIWSIVKCKCNLQQRISFKKYELKNISV